MGKFIDFGKCLLKKEEKYFPSELTNAISITIFSPIKLGSVNREPS